MIMPAIISHLAAVGNASIAPVGPTGSPQAGPTLAIAVYAAVTAVRTGSPVQDSSTMRTPKLKKKNVMNAMTELMTSSVDVDQVSSSSACSDSLKKNAALRPLYNKR